MSRAGCVGLLAALTVLAAGSATPAPGFAASAATDSAPRGPLDGCTSPPAPDSPTKGGHTRSSSYSPHARAHHPAYGAPVQRPILSKRKRHKHHAESAAAAGPTRAAQP